MDDELSSFEEVLLDAHLAVCPGCRRFADDVCWQTETLRGVPAEFLPRSTTIPARRSWRRPLLGVSTAAVAVAASVVALAIGLRGPTSTHAPSQPPRFERIQAPLTSLGDMTGLPRGRLTTETGNASTVRGDPRATS
jgi:hypothetical protein